MAMRGRCGGTDLAVSRLPVAAQRLVPVDVWPARMGDGRYLPCWVGRWTPAAVGSCTPLRCGCTPH